MGTYVINAKNQVTSPSGFGYDASGNVTDSGAYTYNAENELTFADGFTYAYDGDGHRLEKLFGGTVQKIYWYGGGSAPLDETDGTGSTSNANFSEYLFFGDARIARRDSSGDVFYYVADHLGTSRAIAEVPSGQSSVTLCYDADFYPFGGEMTITNSCQQNYKFTGKERDSESGLDNFGARYNSSQLGRFMSPDPAGMFAVRLAYPQTLNRYSYVLNNPLSLADPLGLDCAYLNDAGNGIESIDQNSSASECGTTGGYWVEGTLTQASIDSNETTISLQGTTNGTDVTSASYQQNTTLDVGWFQNSFINPFGHIALGTGNGPLFGQNPASDLRWGLDVGLRYDWWCEDQASCEYSFGNALSSVTVPGAIKQQNPNNLTCPNCLVSIPITGMQASLIQQEINQSVQNPPPYSVGGPQPACDCGTWAQGVMAAAGVQSGAPALFPQQLIRQLVQIYGPR